MRRVVGLAAALLLLLLAIPVAVASDTAGTGRFLMAAGGDLDVPAGQEADVVLVFDGDLGIGGSAKVVVVTGGTLSVGGTVDTVVVIDGAVLLGPGARVTGDIWTADATVEQTGSAVVEGEVRGLGGSLATLGVMLIPAFLLFMIGVVLVTAGAAIVVALIAARQVRTAEAIITREPGLTLVVGFVGGILLPIAAVAALFTVVGAPLALVFLLGVLPALAWFGWMVAAFWVGDWILARSRGAPEPDRPVLAAIVGVVILSVAGLFPLVTAVATAFGFGALLTYGWRLILGHPVLPGTGPTGPPPEPATT